MTGTVSLDLKERLSLFLSRIPWMIGIVCSAYLLIGSRRSLHSKAPEYENWTTGGNNQSYFSASLLVYSAVAASVLLIFQWKKRVDIPGLILIIGFMAVTLLYAGTFLHKTKGFTIWPF